MLTPSSRDGFRSAPAHPPTIRQPSSAERGDPFAPLPDKESIPLLPRELEHPLADAIPQVESVPRAGQARRTSSASAMPRRQCRERRRVRREWGHASPRARVGRADCRSARRYHTTFARARGGTRRSQRKRNTR